MGVDARTRQRQLWDILGKPENKQFTFDPILTGKRIGAGRGEYWYGKGGTGTGAADDDKGEDNKDRQDDKNSGKNQSNNGGDPRRDPAKGCPKPGDSVPGLKDMRDCTTGRCVNVNFTLPAPAPQGWDSVCRPPLSQQTSYFQASNIKYYYNSPARPAERAEKKFRSRDDAVTWLKTLVPPNIHAELDRGTYDQSTYRWRDGNSYGGGSYSIFKISKGNPNWQPPTQEWPQEVCAEIVSTATGFAPACEEHDPNLPPQLKGDNSALRLCDANGNEITIRRNGKGWVYETATCTVIVNDGGVVDNVRDKAP